MLTGTGAANASTPATSSVADQCGRPVSARVGNWYCAEPARGGQQAQPPGFCNSSGCYRRLNDFRADFQSSPGVWGFGGRVLGRQEHYVTWQLTGARMTARPVYYRNSVDTIDVVFSGDLLNAAPGVIGGPVGGAYSLHNAGAVPGGTQRAWAPNGYTAIDRSNFDHVQVIQFSWAFPGYPGYWYTYVKSLNATSTDKTIYRFRGVDQLPADPYGGGYRL